MQPLSGGAPVQLTHFDTELSAIVAYAWLKDGKKMAITRARYNDTDVVIQRFPLVVSRVADVLQKGSLKL
ncbi:MAG TPA: hypothetical protein VEK33_16560 [Terriglobales bacterium]|nr:hypothetical protein [Terriglobales bacterium]